MKPYQLINCSLKFVSPFFCFHFQGQQCCRSGSGNLCHLCHVLCAGELCAFPDWRACVQQQAPAVCVWDQPNHLLGVHLDVGYGESAVAWLLLSFLVKVVASNKIWCRMPFLQVFTIHRIFCPSWKMFCEAKNAHYCLVQHILSWIINLKRWVLQW